MSIIDTRLLEFSTHRQAEIIEAVNRTGSQAAAAEELGISPATIGSLVKRVREKAQKRGYSPEHGLLQTLPAGQVIKNLSRLQNEDGQLSQQWVKSTREGREEEDSDYIPDPKTIKRQSRLLDADGKVIQHWVTEEPNAADKAQLWETYAKALAEDIPRLPAIQGPRDTEDKLCNVYTMTDCHMGMLAWHEEGGADWDITIARDTLKEVFQRMVSSAPNARHAVVAQLGDFLHYDSLQAVTPTSGHILDADTRFEKLVRYAAHTLRSLVDMALEKHEHVYVLMAEGNHDMASSAWLRTFFAMLYENEPRVIVNTSPLPFYCHTHGDVMLMWHHGHMAKNANLPLIAASQFPKEWGETTKRYAHCGDKHHRELKEHAGMIVEQHTTLASRDAYASRHGWQSERSAAAITYHKEFGEVGRVVVTPEMVR